MHDSGYPTNMTQIYAWAPLEWGAEGYTLCPWHIEKIELRMGTNTLSFR